MWRRPASELPAAEVALRCMHAQWRRLMVWTSVADHHRLSYVAGKDSSESEVARDDLWMAFGIGLRWCTRFTTLLPSDDEREQLVVYMRGLKGRVGASIQAVLRDAGLGVDAEPEAEDLPPVVPGPPPSTEDVDALVAIHAAIASCLVILQEVRNHVRHVILAHRAAGFARAGRQGSGSFRSGCPPIPSTSSCGACVCDARRTPSGRNRCPKN